MDVIQKEAPSLPENEAEIKGNKEHMAFGELIKEMSYTAIENCVDFPVSNIHHLAKSQFGDSKAKHKKCMGVFVPFFTQLYNKKLYPPYGESEDEQRTAS